MRFLLIVAMLIPTSLAAEVKGRDGKVIDCYCTDRSGARVEMGQTICLQVDGRMFLAQCQMSLNVPMWRKVQEGCLSSQAKRSNPFFDPVPVNADI